MFSSSLRELKHGWIGDGKILAYNRSGLKFSIDDVVDLISLSGAKGKHLFAC